MNKLKLVLGMIWASPITLLSCFYVLPFWLFKWYKYEGFFKNAWLWTVSSKAPKFVLKRWKKYAGMTTGNFIVMKKHPKSSKSKKKTLKHEQEHVNQIMMLGIFQPILYTLCLLLNYVIPHASPYRDNPFEVAARRAAKQEKK